MICIPEVNIHEQLVEGRNNSEISDVMVKGEEEERRSNDAMVCHGLWSASWRASPIRSRSLVNRQSMCRLPFTW